MSEIRATTISDLAGTGPATLTKQSAAKAWVNFNGSGTPAVSGSFNVSSITDRAAGKYAVVFTSSFANANHSSSGNGKKDNTTDDGNVHVQIGGATDYTTLATEIRIAVGRLTQTFDGVDSPAIQASTHGDLA